MDLQEWAHRLTRDAQRITDSDGQVVALVLPSEVWRRARAELTRTTCEHAEVEVFRSLPPHAKCLQCGARVKQVWVTED